jgi:hypothetical protein
MLLLLLLSRWNLGRRRRFEKINGKISSRRERIRKERKKKGNNWLPQEIRIVPKRQRSVALIRQEPPRFDD